MKPNAYVLVELVTHLLQTALLLLLLLLLLPPPPPLLLPLLQELLKLGLDVADRDSSAGK
jgi:hypothetical protein